MKNKNPFHNEMATIVWLIGFAALVVLAILACLSAAWFPDAANIQSVQVTHAAQITADYGAQQFHIQLTAQAQLTPTPGDQP